jgi:TPR repeat protein
VEVIQVNISDLRQKAESGSVVAQSILGICYLNGTDVEVDYNEAFRLLSAAAGRGAPRAATNLARMYADGLAVPQNLSEAIRLYEVGAKGGEFFAQIALGRIYSKGVEIPADPNTALSWYAAAAAQEGKIIDCDELLEAKDYVRRHPQ